MTRTAEQMEAALVQIALIAHEGGIMEMDLWTQIAAIRRLSAPYWRGASETQKAIPPDDGTWATWIPGR